MTRNARKWCLERMNRSLKAIVTLLAFVVLSYVIAALQGVDSGRISTAIFISVVLGGSFVLVFAGMKKRDIKRILFVLLCALAISVCIVAAYNK